MVGHGQQAVGIRREIHTDNVGLFVDDVIEEAGILVTESVVVLPPDMRREQVVERRNWPAPRNLPSHLEPFGVLIEHGVHNVNECLIAGEKAVTAGEQISFEPALAHMLAQNLQYAAI